ncbi:hypothetical protein [Gimesia fumaroli]|uniref:Uncharacterized protein n=1 Tax=Gimesia fumaroli TaxID=2527976 RepID=A0A518I877_9PLAN|nr:hypothetical protein [Gimesia fumaroli]QDV49259.1 hypothetical protein Enr17x_12760 [Gimesia fumaroli]
MNLVEYQSELESMVEMRNFDQRPRLENLAISSPEHQRVWEDYLIVEHALPAWKQALPEIDLVEAVMSQLDNTDRNNLNSSALSEASSITGRSTHASARWWYGSLLTAAVILVAVSLNFPGDQPDVIPPNTIATNTHLFPETQTPDSKANTPNQSFNQLLRNAGAASWGLAQSTAGTMTEAVSLVPVTRPRPESTSVLPDEPHWVDDINHEMQPLKNQISHAWNFILHSVPEESTKI